MNPKGGLPTVQPGAKVACFREVSGTLGPLALSRKGDLVMITTGHQLGKAKKGDLIFLKPHSVPVAQLGGKTKIHYKKKAQENSTILPQTKISYNKKAYDLSFRIRGVAEDLPMVLKDPIIPEEGRWVIKSGMATGVTKNKVLKTDAKATVTFSDGSVATFIDQIMTGFMGTDGDSGSFVLTEDTLEPVGLLFAGNDYVTYHNRLTEIAKKLDLRGYVCPLSLPKESHKPLRYIASSILPDGIFAQRRDLLNDSPENILKKLGITEVTPDKAGGFQAFYEDLILTTNPHKPGDEGSLITIGDDLTGLAVAGNENRTLVIKIQRVLDAFNLELVTPVMNKEAFATVLHAGYWRIRCKHCGATIRPGSEKCFFCSKPQ